VPVVDRKPGVLSLGEATVSAAESGLSIRRDAKESSVYVARGLAHVSAPGGRVEVRAGERALRTRPVPYPTAHAVRA
jgi:ferric-dicitrate binding protein FerR (iron transport regulator)